MLPIAKARGKLMDVLAAYYTLLERYLADRCIELINDMKAFDAVAYDPYADL